MKDLSPRKLAALVFLVLAACAAFGIIPVKMTTANAAAGAVLALLGLLASAALP